MGEGKVFTLSEVFQHNHSKDCWLLIGNKVYDVTRFLADHPGGDEVLLNATGKDATEEFEDVGHSTSAKAMLGRFYLGDIDTTSIPSKTNTYTPTQTQTQTRYSQDKKTQGGFIKLLQFLVPLLILGLGAGIAVYYKDELA